VIFGHVGVENAKGANHLAAYVGKQRIFDRISLTETLQNLARVIGDRCRVDSVGFELFERELQLDELIAAVGSPISTAAEYEQQAIRPQQVVQLSTLAVLISERKIRDPFADLWSGLKSVVLSLDELQPVSRCDIRATGSHPADHSVQN
jgi:hypothetical protein